MSKKNNILTDEELKQNKEKTKNENHENKENEEEENFTFMDIITSPDCQVDTEATLTTFNFFKRTIYIVDEIEPAHADAVFESINFWNKADEIDKIPVKNREPINIYINTPGGDLNAAFSIIGAIKASKTPVNTITYGTGYSAGFFIGICGHKRYGLPYSSYLLHEGSSMQAGDSQKFLQNANFYKCQLGLLKKIVLENTKIPKKTYEKKLADDWFMTVEDALKFGVIDEVLKF